MKHLFELKTIFELKKPPIYKLLWYISLYNTMENHESMSPYTSTNSHKSRNNSDGNFIMFEFIHK